MSSTTKPGLIDTLRELSSHGELGVTQVLRSLDVDIGKGQTLVEGGNEDELPELAPTGQLGRYQLLDEIGRGGRGRVLRALDPELQRCVAVKLLHEQHHNRPALARFLAEAQVTAQLEHPAIVPVHDIGLSEDGALYYAMKEIRGVTLQRLLEGLREGDAELCRQWDQAALLRAFVRVCEAIEYAHSRGVLHRDLKPSNIVFGDFGEVYVVDWGVARIRRIDEHDSAPEIERLELGETAYGTILGTPGYISPEQTSGRSQDFDPRDDVWSLGALLYELLTLEPYIQGETVSELLRATLDPSAQAARERDLSARLPAALSELCRAALASTSSQRLGSARELAAQLQRHLASLRRREEDVASWLAGHVTSTSTAVAARVARIQDALRGLTLSTRMSLKAEAPPERVAAWVAHMRMRYSEHQHYYSARVTEAALAGEAPDELQNWYSHEDLSEGHDETVARMYRLRLFGPAMQDAIDHYGVSFAYFMDASGFCIARPLMTFGHGDPILPPRFDFCCYTAFEVAAPTANPERLPRRTPPHVDYALHGLITAFTRPVYDGDAFIGVWAMDVPLSALHVDTGVSADGEMSVFIVDRHGSIVAHPAFEAYTTPAEGSGGTEPRQRWTLADPRLDELDPATLLEAGSGHLVLGGETRTLLCYRAVPGVEWLVCGLAGVD